MKTKNILSCLLAVLLPSLAIAVPKDGKGPRNLDTNGDGVITQAEAQSAGATRISENFATIDTDGNGELTRQELRAHKKNQMQERRQKAKEADTDGNGAISTAEAKAADMKRLLKDFDRIDTNSDGEVTREEMRAFHEANGGKGKGKGKGPGNGQGKGGKGPGKGQGPGNGQGRG